MRSDIERTIMRFYPSGTLKNPIQEAGLSWDFDPKHATLKRLMAALDALESGKKSGARGGFDVSEEVVLGDRLHLSLCYLGPYAAVNHGAGSRPADEDERALLDDVARILERHGYELLDEPTLNESVGWIREGQATVWSCLFAPDER